MNFHQLINSLCKLDSTIKQQVTQAANTGLTLRNWLVGAYIVEFEQNGEDRANYGENLISNIAERINIKGLRQRNLASCCLFFRKYPNILQTVSAKSPNSLTGIAQTLSAKYPTLFHQASKTSDKPSDQTSPSIPSDRPEFATPIDKLICNLSFSHFLELIRINDPLQRVFYEIECLKGNWSVRELKRQMGSLLYERTGLSEDKEKLIRISITTRKT